MQDGHGIILVLKTERIGPLTGSQSDFGNQNVGLLQDTTVWGVRGVDEGVSVIYNGRTYIYFGDVDAVDESKRNQDLIAWTGDVTVLRNGGHSPSGAMLYLPNDHWGVAASTEQPDWRFCLKCNGLFYCPREDATGTRCPAGGEHLQAGYDFFLPNLENGAGLLVGQVGWRYCRQCHGLCFSPDGSLVGACPAGGQHWPIGWTFVLPDNPLTGPLQGQGDWQRCAFCAGIFFDGYAAKGLCPGAPGGGLRLNPVLGSDGQFYGFNADPPVGYTWADERPCGAFVWNNRVYMFANTEPAKYSQHGRDGNPQLGTYLVSTTTPDQPSKLTTEYLFSPRIGKCIKRWDGTVFSHAAMGFEFSMPHSDEPSNWRFCTSCLSLVDSSSPGACFGSTTGHTTAGFFLHPAVGTNEDGNHQSSWFRCSKCMTMVFGGYDWNGQCPAGEVHAPERDVAYSLPHDLTPPDDGSTIQGGWRFCVECQGMVWTWQEYSFGGPQVVVVTTAEHPELPQPPATPGVAFSDKSAVMVSHRFGNGAHPSGFSLACWPLPANGPPRLQDVLYYDPDTGQWTQDVNQLQKNFFDYPGAAAGDYTETGLLWLPGPQLWMMTFTYAQHTDDASRQGVVVARFAKLITQLRAEGDVRIFDPVRDGAWGSYMDGQGGAYSYGPYPLEQYTTWNADTRILDLHYLLSVFVPYQVQVMHTQLLITA
jgi:hypothetical protein